MVKFKNTFLVFYLKTVPTENQQYFAVLESKLSPESNRSVNKRFRSPEITSRVPYNTAKHTEGSFTSLFNKMPASKLQDHINFSCGCIGLTNPSHLSNLHVFTNVLHYHTSSDNSTLFFIITMHTPNLLSSVFILQMD